jgi:putative lipoprotein
MIALAVMALTPTALAQSVIEGTATFRERMTLPPTAVFEGVLEDVSRADAPAETIARTRIPSPGNPPIAFTIAYDPAKITANRRYVVRARILLDDKPLFTTDTAYPVITGGSPSKVAVMLRRVRAGQPQASGLAGTTWQLVKFHGSDDTTLTPDDVKRNPSAHRVRLFARLACLRRPTPAPP